MFYKKITQNALRDGMKLLEAATPGKVKERSQARERALTAAWLCLDCGKLNPLLTQHGRCPSCSSTAVCLTQV